MATSATARLPARGAIVVHRFGQEREPVLVVDDATGGRAALVDYAATRSRFAPAASVGSHYPGLLGPAPTEYIRMLVDRVLALVPGHFGSGALAPARARGNFSLVTTPPADLSPDQRVPHVDAADRMQFAAVHFLAADNPDGTGFFRHRATGFETIDPERLPAYTAARASDPPPPAGYEAGAGASFEMIGRVAAAPDRLVIYRAALLHSGLIAALPAGADDPRRGRLTGNLFLQCRLAA